jgi:hypothetical protein
MGCDGSRAYVGEIVHQLQVCPKEQGKSDSSAQTGALNPSLSSYQCPSVSICG